MYAVTYLCPKCQCCVVLRTRPSKQCGFCNYLLDKSFISQDCQSGRGGAGCPNFLRVSRSQGLMVSRSQGLKVSRSQGLKVSRSQRLKVSRSQGHDKGGYGCDEVDGVTGVTRMKVNAICEAVEVILRVK